MQKETQMKAMVYDDYGDASVLHLCKRPLPRRLPGQVVIKVEASSVNPIDYRTRRGEMKWILPFGFPRIPGYDVAGVIAEAADDSSFSTGERVMAFVNNLRGGASAEFVACATGVVATIPDEMTIPEAAAIPLAGTTALQSLRDHGQIQAGQRVLINGASGGVGMFAVQIAKAYGCHVDAIASGRNESFCHSLGADRFFDYTNVDFTKLGESWDLIFDAAGKSNYRAASQVLNQHGRFVSTEPSIGGLITRIFTWFTAKKGKTMLARPRGSDLQKLIEFWTEGKLKITIDKSFALEDLAGAHRRVEEGVEHGKVVVLHGPKESQSQA